MNVFNKYKKTTVHRQQASDNTSSSFLLLFSWKKKYWRDSLLQTFSIHPSVKKINVNNQWFISKALEDLIQIKLK